MGKNYNVPWPIEGPQNQATGKKALMAEHLLLKQLNCACALGKNSSQDVTCTKCWRDLEEGEEGFIYKSTLSQGVKTVTQSQRISFVEEF